MTSKFISTTDLDFLAYRNSLKEYLSTQETFRDYDFEGSNMAILLDILALNRMNGGYYENMIGSEMFLDTALLKNSVVSRAKELNYTPRSRSAARAMATITVATGYSYPSSVTIPKYYNIKGSGVSANGAAKDFNFVVNTNIVIQTDSFGNYVADEVEIYQGVVVSEAYTANSSNRYVLQSNTIDINSIELMVYNSNTDTTYTTWSRAIDIYGLNGQSNIYFVQGYHDDKYELVFGNGVIGRALTPGNVVKIKYISTTGEDGNGMTAFNPTTSVEGYTISSIVVDSKTVGGGEREDIESIKFHAPRHFTTQERGVIDTDFENLVRVNFPSVQSVIAYGGELLSPPQYGRVAISVKPFGVIGNISDKLKLQIVNKLKTKSTTTEPIIIDADYFYIKADVTVYYNENLISKSLNQLKTEVISAIVDFGDDNLTDFNSDFRYSKFIKAIDDVDDAIISNDTTIKMIKRWNPVTGATADTTIEFGVPLMKYSITDAITSGTLTTLSSSLFTYTVRGISYSARLEDNGVGGLKVIANNDSRTVLLGDAGSIDYETGEVSISSSVVVSSYTGSAISVYVITRNKDITVDQNHFLILDVADVAVKVEKAST